MNQKSGSSTHTEEGNKLGELLASAVGALDNLAVG
jgi:hypothetical protein